jgi:hypothetical protein
MKIIVIMTCLLISINSNCQEVIFNNSLTDTSKSIVYEGVANEMIFIRGLDFSASRFYISFQNVISSKPTGAYTYALIPMKNADSCIAMYVVPSRGKDSVVLRKAFKVLSLPKPSVQLGKFVGAVEATVGEILSNTTVSINLPGCYYKHSFEPVHYFFRIENDYTNYTYRKKNLTNQLTKDQLELIKNCSRGTSIIVDAVKYKSKKDGEGDALSLHITVKE